MYYKLGVVGDTYPQVDLKEGIFKNGVRPDYKKIDSKKFIEESIDLRI